MDLIKISNWDSLDGLKNDKYIIKYNREKCYGWVIDVDTEEHVYFLQQHIFSPMTREHTTEELRKLGFNVEILAE